MRITEPKVFATSRNRWYAYSNRLYTAVDGVIIGGVVHACDLVNQALKVSVRSRVSNWYDVYTADLLFFKLNAA